MTATTPKTHDRLEREQGHLKGHDYVTDEQGENPRDVYTREPLDL